MTVILAEHPPYPYIMTQACPAPTRPPASQLLCPAVPITCADGFLMVWHPCQKVRRRTNHIFQSIQQVFNKYLRNKTFGTSSFPSAQSRVLHAIEKQTSSYHPVAPPPTPWLGRYPRPDDNKGSGSQPGHWGPSQRQRRGPETFSQMECAGAEEGDPGLWSVLWVLALTCPRAGQTAVLGPQGRREGAGAPNSGSSACAMHVQLWQVSPHPAPAQVEGATDCGRAAVR